MPNRSIRRRVLSFIAVLAAVLASVTVATLPASPAQAANAAQFNPGRIISDQIFYDGRAITAAQAQAVIVAKGANCTNNGSTPCLKNLAVNSPAMAASAQCAAVPARNGISAGTVFAMVGAACSINPRVLIVLVEKEQGLVSATSPSSRMYDEAAGFACPDSAPCSETFSGFFNQIYAAARQFELYRQFPTSFNYQAGRVNNIQYNPNTGCGTEAVFIQNQATAGLYDYTPYVPNSAALANLYGVGNSCSSYGNRNFWRIFSDWFGNPSDEMLSCPTFDGCSTGWNFSSSTDRALYSGAAAHSGSGYLAAVPRTSGAGLNQEIGRTVNVGDQYEGSVWVRSATAGRTVKGRVVVWGVGGSGNENSVESFSVGSAWTQLTVDFQSEKRSHTAVIFQLFLDSPGLHYDIDDASLTPIPSQPAKTSVPLQSPSFESGSGPWPTSNGFVNRVVYSGAAENGSKFFATNTSVAGNSFFQRVSWPVSTAGSYTARIWLKSASGKPYTGRFALWATGGANSNAVTSFTVGGTWTPVQVTLPVTARGQTQLILEIYEDTTGKTLYVDNASLATNELPNGSLEKGSNDWSPHESGTNLAVQSSNPTIGYVDGSHIGAMNVATSRGSVEASISRKVWTGQSYTVTMWVRTANAGETFSGTLALWEIGPEGDVNNNINFTVGNQWKQLTVTHPIQHSSAASLEVGLYATTVGTTVDFDGATVN